MNDLVTVLSIFLDLQLTNLYDCLVLARIDSHAKAEIDSCARIGILRSNIDVIFLTEWSLRHVDWILIAFLLFVDACF